MDRLIKLRSAIKAFRQRRKEVRMQRRAARRQRRLERLERRAERLRGVIAAGGRLFQRETPGPLAARIQARRVERPLLKRIADRVTKIREKLVAAA